jgi:hypothetical protein
MAQNARQPNRKRPNFSAATYATAPSTSNADDLVVQYLEEDKHGIVVFGLNRPKVSFLLFCLL